MCVQKLGAASGDNITSEMFEHRYCLLEARREVRFNVNPLGLIGTGVEVAISEVSLSQARDPSRT